jgi:hypothetical protein
VTTGSLGRVSNGREGFRGQGARLTYHVSGSSILAKELLLLLQRIAEPDQELCPALESSQLIARTRLRTLGQLLDRQVLEAILVDLVFVVRISRENPLSTNISGARSPSYAGARKLRAEQTYRFEHL